MIWSFIKVAFFFILIAGAAVLANYFADTGGGIRIAIAQKEFSLGPVQSVIALLLAVLALWLLLKVLSLAIAVVRFINDGKTDT